MSRLTGYVFDQRDDFDGRVMRSIVDDPSVLPDFVKTASAPSEEEVRTTPDDNFALVLVDSGRKMKKYATVDKGNTLLSTLYLIKQAHLLPEEAVKVAATNLVGASLRYGLPIPEELVKLAKMGRVTGKSEQKPYAPGAKVNKINFPPPVGPKESLENPRLGQREDDHDLLNRVNMGGTPGTNFVKIPAFSAKEKQQGSLGDLEKQAGIPAGLTTAVRNTANQGLAARQTAHQMGRAASKTLAQGKVSPALRQAEAGSVARQLSKTAGAFGDSPGEVRTKTKEWRETPYVDVSSWDPQGLELTDRAPPKQTLLGDRYPVDSYAQVKMASTYFFENRSDMHPADRREYCVKLAGRMRELSMEVPEDIDRYGSPGYSADADALLEFRRNLVTPEFTPALDMLIEKRASISPEVFAETLLEFDKMAGLNWIWGERLPDPYYSVFGPSLEKVAESDWSYDERGVRINLLQLEDLARNQKLNLKKQFGEKFMEEFVKNPRVVFDSLPKPNKLILARMAQGIPGE